MRVKELSDKINFLLEAHKMKEAFEILRAKGNRLCYVEPNHHMTLTMTRLFESDLN